MSDSRDLNVVQGPPITVIEKNKGEQFWIQVREFRGHKLLNCHVWYRSADGQMRPGKSDLSVKVEKARDLLSAMQKVLTEAGF
jgi:hypothetical protein